MLYGAHRGLIRLIRKLLNPILKLFFNPNTLIQVLDKQTNINTLYEAAVLSAPRKEPAARRGRRAVLRARAQPRAGADARRHRESKPQDAARIAVEPDGLRRAARTGAGNRRPVPAGHGPVARAAADSSAAAAGRSTASAAASGATAGAGAAPRHSHAPADAESAQIRRVSRTLRAGAAAGGADAAAVADARRARAWQQTERRRSCVTRRLPNAAARRPHGRRSAGRRPGHRFRRRSG